MRDEISTLHGDLRLLQRVHEFDTSMTELWDESIPCEVRYHGYDEARVSPEYDLVLLKEDGQIITLLPETHNVTIDGANFEQFMDDALEGEK